jgi:catechol 2,3-dioxygenase-like lactoylglutathione lyase family enzyme
MLGHSGWILWIAVSALFWFPERCGVNAFATRIALDARGTHRCTPQHRRSLRSFLRSKSSSSSSTDNDNNDEPIRSSASPNASMRSTSRLSHAMLKVSSVDSAVDFWKSRGGIVARSRSNGKTNGEAELLSAFVELGPVGSSASNDSDNDDSGASSFALELTKAPVSQTNNSQDHHGLSYLGLSMLLKFRDKNPLLEMMKGTADNSTDADTNKRGGPTITNDNKDDDDSSAPGHVPIRYVASAPGDGFARLALVSDDKLEETRDFYTSLLGMNQKAQDASVLCLRYDSSNRSTSSSGSGVATTLVFENRPCQSGGGGDNDDAGCFDHLSISTTSSIGGLYRAIQKKEDPVVVYMKPTPMFGSTLLGLIDPNGYKVVVFGRNE